MKTSLSIALDRRSGVSLSEQIRASIAGAIRSGVLVPGARLPSWLDLAAQLGVSRGTVKVAYERLCDEQWLEASRSAGTRVAWPRAAQPAAPVVAPATGFFATYQAMTAGPGTFQTGIPGATGLPDKLAAAVRRHALPVRSGAPALYPDPRGELALRREIAAYLAIARGLSCRPEQVFVCNGFSGGLGVALRVLNLAGRRAWTEEPGFLFTRTGLAQAGLEAVAVPVDAAGMDIAQALRLAPDAALAVVTPGQQAPLGATLAPARREQLLAWAAANQGWVIEDDYLSELQLSGRAAPALASWPGGERVIHIGSFSKTISPLMRLGFVVAPPALVGAFADGVAALAPAPWPALQLATAQFMGEGHYIRHLRRSKRRYLAQRDALVARLQAGGMAWQQAGLSVLMALPPGFDDVEIAARARALGLAPSPLSAWFAQPAAARQGLLLGVAAAALNEIEPASERLLSLLAQQRPASAGALA